jgi:autophagy-related protein 13
MPGYNDADEGSGDSGVIQSGGPSKDAVKKLDQIIQVLQITTTDISKSSKN